MPELIRVLMSGAMRSSHGYGAANITSAALNLVVSAVRRRSYGQVLTMALSTKEGGSSTRRWCFQLSFLARSYTSVPVTPQYHDADQTALCCEEGPGATIARADCRAVCAVASN